MNTAQSNNSEKLLTLKEASVHLGVPIETLLFWNEHNILKPTITVLGEIGYTKTQLNQFLTIRQSVEEATSPKQSGKTNFPRIFSSFTVIVVCLTIAALTVPGQDKNNSQPFSERVLGIQTSSFNLSEQIIAALPIHLRHQAIHKEYLQDEGERVSREKITVPALYASRQTEKTTENEIAIKAKPETNSQIDTSSLPATYALLSGGFTKNAFDETSAIDAEGNIQGEVKTDTLASIVGGIDNSFTNDKTQPANQLILLSIAAVVIFSLFQKQFRFALDGTKSPSLQLATSQAVATPPVVQKVLEVDQKTDGTVILIFQGKEYKISKPEMNSESDQFIETLMSLATPLIKEIEYDMQTAENRNITTPLSRLVTRLGFVGVKRDLFFPRTSKNSVIFRRFLTQKDLSDMNLTTEQLLNEFRSIN